MAGKNKIPHRPTSTLIIIIVVIAVLFGYQSGIGGKIDNDNSSVTSSTNPTNNWKTYTNSAFNFTLQYPPELTIQVTTDNLANLVTLGFEDSTSEHNSRAIIKGNMITIKVWPPTDEGFVDRYCDSQRTSDTTCNTTSVNGNKAVEIIQSINGKTKRKEVAIQISKNETVSISSEISDITNQSFFSTYDQILTTFTTK